jgi:predicted acyltransferase
MMYIPTPGYGSVMFEPGKNLAAWIDSLLQPGKMWQGTWDPEGIFSTLPAIVTGIAGMLAGRLIPVEMPIERKVIWLYISGFVACTVEYSWSWIFPLNKNLRTSSYVLFTGGLAGMLLASFMFLVDVQNAIRIARVGIIFGENAITIYVLADLLAILLYEMKFHDQSISSQFMNILTGMGMVKKTAILLFALFCVAINFIPAYWLHRKKILIRL